jgi:hypothetical protein
VSLWFLSARPLFANDVLVSVDVSVVIEGANS